MAASRGDTNSKREFKSSLTFHAWLPLFIHNSLHHLMSLICLWPVRRKANNAFCNSCYYSTHTRIMKGCALSTCVCLYSYYQSFAVRFWYFKFSASSSIHVWKALYPFESSVTSFKVDALDIVLIENILAMMKSLSHNKGSVQFKSLPRLIPIQSRSLEGNKLLIVFITCLSWLWGSAQTIRG